MTLEKILEEVVDVTGVAVEEMEKYRGSEEANEAKLLFYEIGRRCGFTYREIGSKVKRKHSSVTTAIKTLAYTPDFKVKMEEVLDKLGLKEEPDEEVSPLWDENFKIIDISSRYFGSCFMGIDNGKIVAHGCRPKVINAMLDRRN